MTQTVRHPLRDGLTAVTGMAALVGGLALLDDRVRAQLASLVENRAPTSEVRAVGREAEALAFVVMQAVRDQSLEHAPMVIFALAALVLLLFMTRT